MSAVATVHSRTTLGPTMEAQCMLSLFQASMFEPVGCAAALSRSGVAFLRYPEGPAIDGVVVVEAESS